MNDQTALARQPYSTAQAELIRRQLCAGATDDELEMFLGIARRTGLDPFGRQIFLVKRWDANQRREVMSVQISIDGQRLIADRSNKYAGQIGPEWCGPDGQWCDVWLSTTPPMAARVAVVRHDFIKPLWGIARFESYAQRTKDGQLTRAWRTMPDLMIAKCAEALALRKAFPQDLSGIYTDDEMAQATTPATTEPRRPRPPAMNVMLTEPDHDPVTGEIDLPHESHHAADSPAQTVDAPSPQSAAGDETDSERIARLDKQLADAARHHGSVELKRLFESYSKEDKNALKSALDRRHKHTAKATDDQLPL